MPNTFVDYFLIKNLFFINIIRRSTKIELFHNLCCNYGKQIGSIPFEKQLQTITSK